MTPQPQQDCLNCDSCDHAQKSDAKDYPFKCMVSKPVPMYVHKYCVSWFGYVGCASHSAASRPAPSPDTCTWKLDDVYGMYETGCGNAFECIEGDIEENNFKFCPYCGGRIKEIVEGAQ